MAKVYLLLGGNLGDSVQYLERATKLIEQTVGKIDNISSLYETEPWGFASENLFVNQVISLNTKMQATELLTATQNIENQIGRQKAVNNTAENPEYTNRTIDIDILFYDDLTVQTSNLSIPHKHLHKRRFTLEPLCEIAPELVHPLLLKTVDNLLKECNDSATVRKMYANNRFFIGT